MYTQLNTWAPDIPAIESLSRLTWSDKSDWSYWSEPIKSSQAQSSRVKPSQTKSSHPSPLAVKKSEIKNCKKPLKFNFI